MRWDAKLPTSFAVEEVVAICVLQGSYVFFADLVRNLDLDIQCEFMGVSSYHGQSKSSGEVKVTLDLTTPLEGKNVLLIEDIVDTGLTMNYLKKNIESRLPKKLYNRRPSSSSRQLLRLNVTLIMSVLKSRINLSSDMDWITQGYYRNLPYIAQVENLN